MKMGSHQLVGKRETEHKGAFPALEHPGALEMNVGNSFLKVKPVVPPTSWARRTLPQ